MTASVRVRRPLPVLVLGLLSSAASAQTVIHAFHGGAADDMFGWPVSGAGDVDGDGIPDVIVGSIGDDTGGNFAGSARVYSGRDGTILHAFFGSSAENGFGSSVSGVGDIDGDGADDVIVGAVHDDGGGSLRGSARVYSGADGSILFTFFGESTISQFGLSVGGTGDVNGDGIPDVIVGAPKSSHAGVYFGSARVFSGADGSVLHTFDGDRPKTDFGFAVSGAGDVNGDGFSDLIVGAPGHFQGIKPFGQACVFSGKDGSTLFTFSGDLNGDRFGSAVAGVGDVNGDGFDDLVVGAPLAGKNSNGRVWIFSGANGAVLNTLQGSGNDRLGTAVSDVGDLDGDGFDDLVIGSEQQFPNAGYALLVSGADGSVIHRFVGASPDDHFGVAVSGVGDVDGDGLGDLIIGAWGADTNGPWSGSAWVFAGPRGGINYCGPANFNSTGQSATISAHSTSSPTSPVDPEVLTMVASQLPPGRWGYFLNSDSQGFKAFVSGSQGNLCLAGGIGRHLNQVAKSGPAGRIAIEVDLTALPRPGGAHSVIVGETWNFQCWFRDANPGATSNLTDGISFTF